MGFIQKFMNLATSHLVNRTELEGVVQNGGVFIEGSKEVISKRKERIISGQVTFFWGEGENLSYRIPLLPLRG